MTHPSAVTFELVRQTLPTDKAVVGAVTAPDRTRYALCCNAMEEDRSATSSPGSTLLACPPDGTWEVVAQLPELSLRSLCCTLDGRVFACGMAGACVEYDPAARAVARHATGARDILWRVHGRSRDAVWVAGENALLRFDGSAWRPLDLAGALGAGAWPTLVDVHAAGDEVVAVGAQIEGSCLLRVDAGGALEAETVAAHSLYACVALGGEDALAMGNDGAWRRSASGWSRVVDLSSGDVRPFGRPGCVGVHAGQVVLASVDGVDVLKALLTDRPSLEGRLVNLWLDGKHQRLALGPKLGASSLAFEGERLVIGLPGQLWDVALP